MDVICKQCGAQNQPGSRFCSVCGDTLPAAPLVPQPVPVRGFGPTQLAPPGSSTQAELLLPDRNTLPLYPLTTLGRDPNRCNLSFPDDERVSRLHARIEQQGNHWVVTDLGSANGTFVNGNRISTPIALQPGDRLGIGRTTYVFNIPGLAPVPVTPPAPPVPVSAFPPPAPLQQGTPWGPPVAQQPPPGGWRSWNPPPLVEGYVRHISERYMMKKDDLIQRGVAAAALAIFISPVLAFLPLMQGNDLAARDLRIEDRLSGRMVDVKVLGDVMGNINQSDAVAVWGEIQGGLYLMRAAYNYATDTTISVRK